jgi:amino acid adenylation domain-containing protein
MVLPPGGRGPAILAPGRSTLVHPELDALLRGVSGQLRAAGISRDDRVVFIAPNGPEAATGFLAIAGACSCAPLNPGYRGAELTYYLNDLRPKLVVHAESVAPSAVTAAGIPTAQMRIDPGAPAGMFTLPDLPSAKGPAPDDIAAVALLLHTSGTTSRPKLVPLTWTNLIDSAENIGRTLQLTTSDRCLNVMPLFHIHGLVAALLSTLRTGGSIVCTPGLLAPSFFDWMDEFAPTWYSAVPTMHQSILARAPRHADSLRRSRLRFVRSSSAPLPAAVLHELESTFRVPVIEAYGMTEAAHQMTSNPLPPLVRKPGSVGQATGPDVTVLNGAGEHAGAGVEGHVCIRGTTVTSGYLENAAANAEAFKNGWFYTGDLGRTDEDGYLFLTGRTKEILNRGGEKISPREVDEALMAHPAVCQCLTFALPDSQLGEEVGVAVVRRADIAVDERQLQYFAATRLADFKVPRRVFFLDEIPAGPTGKLQRIGLAERLGISADSWKPPHDAPTAADDALADAVARVIAGVLDLPDIDPQTGFFDAGGDSLLAARLLICLEREFQKKLTMVDLFAASSARAIAAALVTAPAATPAPIARSEALTLSVGQTRLWLHAQVDEESLAAQTPRLFEIRGHVDPDRVRESLVRIIERHEPLRTVIGNVGGVPCAQLRPAEPLPWALHDWTATPSDQRELSAREICLRDTRRPFRLDADLLLRASLHKLADDRWWLLVLMHHSANDGWSSQVLRRELQTLLEEGTLPPLTASYSDFAKSQQTTRASERHAQMKTYWAAQLAGLPPVLELPLEYPRPGLQTYEGAATSLLLLPSLTKDLRQFGRARGATLFMTLLTGWTCLLSRYSGSTDICVGTPVAGRSRVEFEQLIGLFMNTLVLRTRLDGEPTFGDAVDRVRDTCVGAWDHDWPFEHLVEALPPERNLTHVPYFQVFFQLRNFPRVRPSTLLPVTELDLDFDAMPTDLNLQITETPDGLRCRLGYNAALFTERFAQAMLRHFEVLLGAAVAEPETLVSRLPIMTVDERAALVSRSSPLRRARAEATAVQLFERQVLERGADVAILHRDRRLSYAELNGQVNRLARVLTAAGVGPEQVVALCMDRSAEWIIAMLAAAKAGAAYLSLEPAHPPALVRDVVARAGATLILADNRHHATLRDTSAPVIWTGDWVSLLAGHDDRNPPLVAGPQNLVHVFFTSGSTGQPKGVATEHRHLSAYLAGYHWMPFSPSETCLQFTSATFDPCAAEVWGPLTHGGRCAVHDGGLDDVDALGAWIRSAGVTMCYLSASVFNTLIDEAPAVLRPLRRILIGGEALSVPHIRRALELLPRTELINGYGPTETTIYYTGYRIPRAFETARASIPIGRPLDNGCAYVMDPAGNLLPDGLPGELWLGGDPVSRGYLHDPELTAAAFVSDPIADDGSRVYRTGDRVRRLPDGQLDFLGRADNQVKVRGVRIELGQIEAVLRECPSVRHAVVVATPHAVAGNLLTAFVELRDDATTTAAELRVVLSSRLPGQMVPARIEISGALPLTASGKIDRQLLKRAALQESTSESRIVAAPPPPRAAASQSPMRTSEVENRLAAIWRELLGVRDVTSNDDFFALGGHSLLAVRLAFQIEREFGTRVTLVALFEAATLSQMAALIRYPASRAGGGRASREVGPLPPMLCIGAGPLFRPFADALAPHCQFHSVPTPSQGEGIVTMEDLAARIVPTVLDSHPHGPVVLAGWSLAGVVAIEVAAQLERAGRDVSSVILFDTLSPVRQRQWFARWPRLRQWQQNAVKVWYHAEEAGRHGAIGCVRYLLNTWRDARARIEYDRLLRQSYATSGDADVPLRFRHAFGVYAARYTPSPLRAGVVVVRPERRKRSRMFDGDLGWSELGYRVDLLTVPGDHERMFASPNVAVLAERLLPLLHARRDRKNDCITSRHSASSTPLTTSSR